MHSTQAKLSRQCNGHRKAESCGSIQRIAGTTGQVWLSRRQAVFKGVIEISSNTQAVENSREADALMESVKSCIGTSLQLGGKEQGFTEATPLLGDIPELDSMAVLTLLGSLEEHFGFEVDDDDVSAETFETVGSLVAFVRDKLNRQ